MRRTDPRLVHDAARLAAAARVQQWRDAEREKKREMKRQESQPWWRAMEVDAEVQRLRVWTKEALETAAPTRTLTPSVGGARAANTAGASSEQTLRLRLDDFQRLVNRLQRFALLTEETVSGAAAARSPRGTSVLIGAAGIDECRGLLADLLCALRVAMTSVVGWCRVPGGAGRRPKPNLNLPILRRTCSAAAMAADGGGGGGGGAATSWLARPVEPRHVRQPQPQRRDRRCSAAWPAAARAWREQCVARRATCARRATRTSATAAAAAASASRPIPPSATTPFWSTWSRR